LLKPAIPGITLVSYGGLSLPAGTPAPVVKRVSDALQKALADPRVRAKLEANGAAVVAGNPGDYTRHLESEIALTEKMMKVTNVTASERRPLAKARHVAAKVDAFKFVSAPRGGVGGVEAGDLYDFPVLLKNSVHWVRMKILSPV
jgi:hypothetical protein